MQLYFWHEDEAKRKKNEREKEFPGKFTRCFFHVNIKITHLLFTSFSPLIS